MSRLSRGTARPSARHAIRPARRHPHAPAQLAPGDGGQRDEPRHRIGEAATRVGVSASALRLWERQGLVRPTRSVSRYRLYSDRDIEQLRQVQRMREERVNAPGIKRLLARPVPGAATEQRVNGDRLRALRAGHGLSLREAATRTGLSVSFISALERNATGASVSTLQRLTSAYGATLLELFRPLAPLGRLVRPAQRAVLELGGPEVRIEQLAVGSTQLEPQLFVLAPGATSDGAYAHEGEEFLFVLGGALTVWVGDDERYALNEGDALSFPSTLSHRWRNDASLETRLLWINTPPTF
jgi:DNA-binding transcriptional MerR regulator/quercetin dioxygenase-like cupin family protein